KVTAASASAAGMVITVLLDVNTAGVPWAEGEYRLFVKFTVGSEVIRKGPYFFQILE
ncbi:MAG: hypothetical protein H0U18_09910, partial [Pyrinomonadaceae bacterium]|nr:hypothetical protein [Pyrinomonadaceae bacterium]